MLQALLLWLAGLLREKEATPRPRPVDEAVEQLLAWIEEDPAHTWSSGELAERLEVSQNHLARAFRRRFGRTISRYILERRMELARHLLRETSLPVKAVAERVGLADPQYFNKLFRRTVGTSPSAFRSAERARG
jgi:AraC family transcriptional regulator